MQKAELRKLYRQKMLTLSSAEHEEMSDQIATLFFDRFDLSNISALHIFLPILRNREINTWRIIDELPKINPDLKIILSKSNFQTYEMTSHIYTKSTHFVENAYGIIEPQESELFDEKKIDMILMPLLAFDLKGNRVGYGKGFYDRFLARCRKDIIKVGLSLFPPVERTENVGEHDITLDYCITPDRVYFIGKVTDSQAD